MIDDALDSIACEGNSVNMKFQESSEANGNN